jgi:putative salt-induced outer membrane protein
MFMKFRKASVCASALLTATIFFAADLPLQPLQQLAQQSKDLLPLPNGSAKKPVWQSSLSLGLSLARGNKDAVQFNGRIETRRKSATSEWLLGLDGSYGEDSGVKNYELLHGYGQFNHYFNPRFYGFLRLDGLHDGIKDIDYRCTASPGLGYFVLSETNLTLALEAGPSLVWERQGGNENLYSALRVAERLEYKMTTTTRVWQGAEFVPELDKPENFIVNAEIGIETAITKGLNLRVYLQDYYVNEPAASIKNNDLRLISGISYKF